MKRLKIWWNKCLLRIIARAVCLLDLDVADEHALWDDAQNALERHAIGPGGRRKTTPFVQQLKLILLSERCFTVLAQRCAERADDIRAENRDAIACTRFSSCKTKAIFPATLLRQS